MRTPDSPEPTTVPAPVAGVHAATEVLLAQLEGLDDAAARGPSGLPGWSRGHVLAHLARHADAQTRVARAAIEGRLVPPYPGGPAGRAAEIEAGSGRPAAELVADVRGSAERLAEAWRAVPPDGWSRPTQAVSGTRPLLTAVVARWVEVGVHHVDLDVGPVEWSEPFVRTALDYVLAGLPGRRRADAAPAAPRRWSVSCPDLGVAWVIHDDPDSTRVTTHDAPAAAGPGGDAEMAGAGAGVPVGDARMAVGGAGGGAGGGTGGAMEGAVEGAGAGGGLGGAVEGTGVGVLRWLTGRGGEGELVAEHGALELPTVFPFP